MADASREKLLERAKEWFKLAQEAEQEQRERERDDLAFQVPELQWDESAKRQRLGTSYDGVPTPARPVLSISRIDQPVQMVLNQERAAHLGVSIQPLSADAETETAAILEGIYRRIERDSQAHIARSWAFSRAVMCGRGAYRVNTQYDETSDDPFDQTITIERILNQEFVYFDPSAQKPDFSDGRFAFVTSWVPWSTFKAEYPDSQTAEGDEIGFEDLARAAPEWVKGDKESRAVLVAECFYKETRFEEVKARTGNLTRKRKIEDVKWAKMTGTEVLEQGDWNGHLIPLIPTIGRELHPFDAKRRWFGVIAPAKDAQRLYNYAASTAVELAALEPKAPYIGAEGQFEGHEAEWQQANIRNFPFLEYKVKSIDGQPLPPPARAQVDVGRLGPSMQLLQQADQFMQVTTATYDPGLGRQSNREKSGRAILALQQQGDESNSHFMHNLADISMNYEARVILDLIPAIYDRPGRMARTLDEEGKSETILLNQPFYREPESERPVPLAPGMVPPAASGMAQPAGQAPAPPPVKHYDLRKGIYTVAISIGKTRQSALQEGAEEIGQILQAQPQLMPIIGPLYFRYRDFPGAKEIADLLAKVRDKTMPGLTEGDENQPTIEQAQGKIAQLEQQLQLVSSQLQGAIEAIKTKQAEQQTALAKTQIEADTKLRVAQMDQQTALMLKALEGKLEQILQAQKLGHESEMQASDQSHEAVMTVAESALKPPDLTFRGSTEVPLEMPPGGKEA